ncbi:MAG TPA: flagellar motor switch phosphatase FliY [Candidatus Obscuribacterales bacterium]
MTLSQDQINAILEGTGTYDAGAGGLGDKELDFFQQFSSIAMESGSVAVSQALGKTVLVAHPEVSSCDVSKVKKELSGGQILIRTGYNTDREYESLLLIKDYDVAVIFDILMGKDGRNPDLEIGDLQISAIGEVMNQLIGAAATALSKEYERKVAMMPPDSQPLLPESNLPAAYQSGQLLQIHYQLVIEGVLDSEIFELRTLESAKQLYRTLTGQQAPAPAQPQQAMTAPQQYAGQAMQQVQTVPGQPAPPVRPVEFAPLGPPSNISGGHNIDRVMDIPLRVTVELGSARLKVKNVLDLSKGSIVELDKLAGEPVDLLVNGRLMAKGEVVVINENFGVRITEILGPADRLQNLSNNS